MRIISGIHRGRRLLAPEGDATRPITDRVKQSVFDILAPRLEGAVVMDVFAGTGSMGLECLSRGAASAAFYEMDRSALSLLRKNIEAMGMGPASRVIPGDIFRILTVPPAAGEAAADVVFLDPPYRFITERAADVSRLAAGVAARLSPGGVAVLRHDAADVAGPLGPLVVEDERSYGSMVVKFLSVPGGEG